MLQRLFARLLPIKPVHLTPNTEYWFVRPWDGPTIMLLCPGSVTQFLPAEPQPRPYAEVTVSWWDD